MNYHLNSFLLRNIASIFFHNGKSFACCLEARHLINLHLMRFSRSFSCQICKASLLVYHICMSFSFCHIYMSFFCPTLVIHPLGILNQPTLPGYLIYCKVFLLALTDDDYLVGCPEFIKKSKNN